MTLSDPSKIQQQMYTRERRGIFRSTEGYDTIAKSKGLDPNWIKKALHPFCVYDAPAELSARGEKEDTAYPKAMHLFHNDTGQMVLGRSVYRSTDFTGLRSTFFTHNYVIPADRIADIVNKSHSWLDVLYIDSYDIEQGMELAELDTLPTAEQRGGAPSDPIAWLESIGIGEKLFKQLLFAVMSSVASKRKVYVALDVPIELVAETACRLLGVLYTCLPYAFRQTLGFITYAKEPQSRKGIHLTFVEKGSLRPNDRNTDKDYTFDLASQRVTNADVDFSKQPYLDLAWTNLTQLDRAEDFYQFAGQMLADMDAVRHTAITSYHELAVFYQVEAGNESLYDVNKNAVLRAMLEYLTPVGAITGKKRLNELFMSRFTREFELVKQRQIPELQLVKCLKEYAELPDTDVDKQLVAYMIGAIHNAQLDKRKDRSEAFYTLVGSQPSLSRAFFDTVLNLGKASELFEPYIQQQFLTAIKAEDVVQLAYQWSSTHPQTLKNAFFVELAEKQLVSKLRTESDAVAAVNATHDLIDELLERNRDYGNGTLMQKLSYSADLFLLTELNLEQVRKEQLLKIGFLQYPDEVKSWAARFNQQVQSKAAIMLAAYQWFVEQDPDETVFDDLTLSELDQVQKLGRNWLQRDIIPDQFGRLVLAFYCEAPSGTVDYGALLHYLQLNSPDKETLYQFMRWSETQMNFVRSRKLVPAYAAAIVSYFKKHDRDAFKNRANRKAYFEQAGTALKPVYEKARMELSSPLVKFFKRNKKVSLMLVTMLVVVGGTLLGLQAAGVFEPPAPVAVEQPSEGKKSETDTLPQTGKEHKPLVFAELVTDKVEGVDKVTTQLVFEVATEAECAAFDTKRIQVTFNDGKQIEYKDRKALSTCKANAEDQLGSALPDKEAVSQGEDKQGSTDSATGDDSAAGSGNTGTKPADTSADGKEKDSKDEAKLSENAGKNAAAGETAGALPYRITVKLGEQISTSDIREVAVGTTIFPFIVK
ncbi:glycosyltransferase [Paenibacillus sp. UMB4589-SE434]|uniref:GAP1-N2 domain-containing protein n=1 Tax=Paenibacillus sp. UMB4589-SE434 TaxID=3046314 RepID=UPI00255116D6|nr:glycosyltransferase [Paenibacillus sp. UMB4589-SE434]MDK8183677.1 glycosyltransferase [Paenibacillus sp. UMB4589-SE434]